MDLFNLEAKKYIIFGASSGIGRQTAVQLSQLGAKLVLTGRNKERLNETLVSLAGSGHWVMPYDLNDVNGIKKFIQSCLSLDDIKFDGLVFSAGVSIARPIRLESMEEFASEFHSSYLSYLAVLKEFSSKRILNAGGSIVVLSSRAALFPEKAMTRYATIKAAINTTALVAAQEFANRKIRVNTICPEMVKTPMTQHFFSVVGEEQMLKFYPLGHLEAKDIANTVVFLLSDMSTKITGQTLYISAGNSGTPITGYII